MERYDFKVEPTFSEKTKTIVIALFKLTLFIGSFFLGMIIQSLR
jgi:hypothetical protein